MTLKIEEIRPSQIAYIRRTGPYGEDNMKTIERIKKWAIKNDLLGHDSTVLGIALDDPRKVESRKCRYDACLVLKGQSSICDEDIDTRDLPGGTYAVLTVLHTSEAIQQAWADIFELLSEKGCQLDVNRDILERYRSSLIEKNLCEICLPIL